MKELDIEIIERDNNIPPEESILVNQKFEPVTDEELDRVWNDMQAEPSHKSFSVKLKIL